MSVAVKNLKCRIERNPAPSFFWIVMASFLPGSVCAALPSGPDAAGENTAVSGPVLESPCAKLPAPCNFLCQEARSAESRAAAFQATAAAARSEAEMAKKRAVYFENLAEKRMIEAQRANKNSYRVIWQSANILLRLIVPKHSRDSQRSDGVLNQSSTSGNRKRKEKKAAEARNRADEAMMAADEAVQAAYEAAREATTARAAAARALRSYVDCSCR